jgi:hypothetical protein
MRYEKKTEPLASRRVYYRRIGRNLVTVSAVLAIMLIIGTIGYHFSTEPNTGWLDAFHNASMILSGMGPVITEGFTWQGKVFSSFYALFSGLVFVGMTGLILAPGLHRIFHRLHIQEK